ncbi:MAG: type II secretion system F family protein [Lachnospiraceae bacterium]|nr:type II secretion system F family protein [Lachnospiraceae bacterium]MDD7378299.1 type II secretion system F family protein [Lachnospiraceae bacterium]MDY4617625.1 type II secretion system F family protein [Lachnospiraceae bacterium]
MKSYSYVAIESDGKEKKGSVEADNVEKAEAKVRSMGLIPLEMKEQTRLREDIRSSKKKKVSPRDLSVFCRQFVSMLRAGVTIVDALDMLIQQTENKVLAQAISETKREIGKGSTLSEAMRTQIDVFTPMLVNMIEAGESSGSIDASMDRMAVQFEKTSRLNGLIIKSMIYPIVLMCVAVVILIVTVTYVIPRYMKMFEGYDFKMPALTVGLMKMSDFVIDHAVIIIAIIVAIVFGIHKWKQTDAGKEFFGKLAIKLPVFKKLNIKTYASMFSRTLSTLLLAGIPMMDALDNVAKTMKNVLYREELLRAKDEVSKGIPLSEPLKRGGMFPPMVVHMLSIGEETGEIEAMLDKLADYYDEEVEMSTQTILAFMEPVIIIFMAVIVVILIAAIMGPMLTLYNDVGNL